MTAELWQLFDGFCVCVGIIYYATVCRIHELQEDIIKVKLDLESAQEYIKHLNTQVRKPLTNNSGNCNVIDIIMEVIRSFILYYFITCIRWRRGTERLSV